MSPCRARLYRQHSRIADRAIIHGGVIAHPQTDPPSIMRLAMSRSGVDGEIALWVSPQTTSPTGHMEFRSL
jgi:hypothetical protein